MSSLALIGVATAATCLLIGRQRRRRVELVVVDPIVVDGSDEDDEPHLRIASLLDELLAEAPRNGHLYQIGRGDTVESIARAVLDDMGDGWTEQMLLDYIHCISSGPYNLGRYGTPSTTKSFPKKWLAPGIGRGLRVAFMPRNQDALALLRVGILPRMVVDPRTGAPRGGDDNIHYGLIWLPPIDPTDFAVGIISCAPYSWEDGSSTIDPDPELLALVA